MYPARGILLLLIERVHVVKLLHACELGLGLLLDGLSLFPLLYGVVRLLPLGHDLNQPMLVGVLIVGMQVLLATVVLEGVIQSRGWGCVLLDRVVVR